MRNPFARSRSKLGFQAAYKSDVGLTRSENQDFLGVFGAPEGNSFADRLYIVADGMGGHENGRMASEMAVETLKESFFSNPDDRTIIRLTDGIRLANNRIFAYAQENGVNGGMGTTCTALAVTNEEYWIGHVGDSRLYQIDQQTMRQLTRDHSVVEALIRGGIITPEQAEHDPRKHTLTSALGIAPDVDPDVFEIDRPLQGDRFLLCSDGIMVVPDDKIESTARVGDIQTACDRLVEAANRYGGPDNSTVVIVEPYS